MEKLFIWHLYVWFHLKSFPTLFLLIQGNFMFSRSYKIVFYALFLRGHYFVEYELMLVCIFYNFFLKTSFSTFSAFCVFCFESDVLNQDIKICYHHLNLYEPISQNGQTYSNNLLGICWQIAWVCLAILWDWRLKG